MEFEIKVKTRKYKVEFEKLKRKIPLSGERVLVPAIKCVIKSNGYQPVIGFANCGPKDIFHLDTGCKLSLERALAHVSTFNKEDREKIWNKFRRMPRW